MKKIFNRRAITILILSLIIILLTFIKLSSKSDDQPSSNNPTSKTDQNNSSYSSTNLTPIPTIINVGSSNSQGDTMFYDEETTSSTKPTSIPKYIGPTLTPQEEEMVDISLDFPLARLLPHKGTYFQANRYIGVNNLEIIVFDKKQTDLAKKEAQGWLVEVGADKYDHFTVVYK